MNQVEVHETVQAANIYLTRLKWLNSELDYAVKQILNTFEETESNIRSTFSKFKDAFIDSLNKREKCLLDKAKKTKIEALAPIRECRIMILDKIESTVKLINTGSVLISSELRNVEIFSKHASLIGTLPEVPELKEVPYISFCYEPSLEVEIMDKLDNLGDIYKYPPVQVADLIEKPGGILVEWKVVVDNEEKVTDIEEFRLQVVMGDIQKDKHLVNNFKDIYKGLDNQYLLKDLKVNEPYSFRVCCKFEGTTEWSPWSLPQVTTTTLKHFSWKFNGDYEHSNEYKIVRPKTGSAHMLYSDGAQFGIGHSIDFIFLESDSNDAVVGLICEHLEELPKHPKQAKDGTFLMTRHGKIWVDGVEKSTVLPEFHRGSKVTFMCSKVNDNKIRIDIDSKDKRVTYDWLVPCDTKMYFVAHFSSSKWKIMVE
ncbi:cytokine receptor-like factor 3 [Diorhabda sublineata]|uniref:cytokine receptor-like factor 3 n=1 Tax=Diorhabda sublineata TaxID=1163346 RepID=UPI0024E0FA6D|nr:cytokine receptor-like factor 3 [Diorhabda sublineata]